MARPPLARIAGSVLLATAAASVVYAIAWLLRPADQTIIDFAANWARMADQPFAGVGQFPHRFLAPLLAHVLGFGTAGWHRFCCLLGVAFLAVVFAFCRARGSRALDALLVTLAVGVSGAVQIYKEFWSAYPDHLTFTLLLACAIAAPRTVVFWTLHFANLCSHEMAFFMLPWLWFVRRQHGASLRADVAGLAITSAAYGAVRLWIASRSAELQFTTKYYADHQLLPYLPPWLLILALQFWLVTYGLLVFVLAWHQCASVFGKERRELWLVLGGLLCVFTFAVDFSRHANVLIIPVILACVRFLGAGHRILFVACIAGTIALAKRFDPAVNQYFMRVMFECGVLQEHSKALTCFIPRAWLPIAVCVAAVVLQIACAALLWRHDARARAREVAPT